MTRITTAIGLLALIMSVGCEGEIGEDPAPVDPVDEVPPTQIDDGVMAELPSGRALRRMTADQYHASLQVVTEQSWDDFDRYAAALGQADYAEVTIEGTDLNITFEKLAGDAARETCNNAVVADNSNGTNVLLRHVTLESRAAADESVVRENLQYLYMRFFGEEVASNDPRLTPWFDLLATSVDEEGEPIEIDDTMMRQRWAAVCVGFATHPDFVTY